jgi:hypothetical protein
VRERRSEVEIVKRAQHRPPVRGELGEEGHDLELMVHVKMDGGFIEEEDLGFLGEHGREEDLAPFTSR